MMSPRPWSVQFAVKEVPRYHSKMKKKQLPIKQKHLKILYKQQTILYNQFLRSQKIFKRLIAVGLDL